MSKTIWKYEIEITDIQDVKMPKDAEILTVQAQRGCIGIWAIVNSEETEIVRRTIIIKGTGHPINPEYNLKYIGTFQIYGGELVFHVFEKLL